LEIERFSGVKADDEVDVSSEDPLLRSQNEVIHTVEPASDAADGMEDDLLKRRFFENIHSPELEPIADEELIDVFEADIDLLPFEFDVDGPRTRQAQLESMKYQFGFGFETIGRGRSVCSLQEIDWWVVESSQTNCRAFGG